MNRESFVPRNFCCLRYGLLIRIIQVLTCCFKIIVLCTVFNDGVDLENLFAFETPIEVTNEMQEVINNHSGFSAKPLGPIHKCINEQLQHYLPPSFLQYYILSNSQDSSELGKLFSLHKEHPPNVIVYPFVCNEMYQDVFDDPDSGSAAITLLQKENPVIANVLIDYFEIHKISMLLQ